MRRGRFSFDAASIIVGAMEIKEDVTLALPRAAVFAAYRDRLEELAPRLPNIRSIKVLSRTDREGEVDLVNEWEGGGDIPAVARAVLSENMLRWTDYATWKDGAFTVDWRTDVHAFPGAVRASGMNRFVDVGERTRLEIRGDLTCDSNKIPGVPRLLARTVNKAAERLLVGQISVNLVAIAKAVGAMLEREKT